MSSLALSAQRDKYKSQRLFWGLLCVLLIIVCGVFAQVVSHDFVNYDDNLFVTENRHLELGLTWEGIRWAWSAGLISVAEDVDYWIPMTHMSRLFDHELFGLNPAGHHAMNLILHLANVALLFGLLTFLTNSLGKSACVAAIFALHPLQVEAVAWVTARKDVLSLLLALGSLWCYALATSRRSIVLKFSCFLLFTLSVLSKPMMVVLPLLFTLLDLWPLKLLEGTRRPWAWARLLLQKWYFFVFSLLVGLWTLHLKSGDFVPAPWASYLGKFGANYGFYLKKAIWPVDLGIYGPSLSAAMTDASVWWGWGLLLGLSAVVIWRRSLPLLVGACWFGLMLLPAVVRALIPVGGFEWPADRHMYAPLIGIAIFMVWGGAQVFSLARVRPSWQRAGVLSVTLILGALTFQQIGVWRNSQTLFTRALEIQPQNYLAFNNLGHFYELQGDLKQAKANYQKALALSPQFELANFNMGRLYQLENQPSRSVEYYERAVRSRPQLASAHNNLGNAYAEIGSHNQALLSYQRALVLNPAYALAHYNLGRIYLKTKQYRKAFQSLSEAQRLDPNDPNVGLALSKLLYEQAVLYGQKGSYKLAIDAYADALLHKPDHLAARANIASALVRLERFPEAIAQYERGLEYHPDYAPFHYALGLLYYRAGDEPEAIKSIQAALELKPDFEEAQRSLARLQQKS